MACPTCSHTMTRLGCQFQGDKTVCIGTFWCPRCGTLSTEGAITAPALVGRVRTFRDGAYNGQGLFPCDKRLWHTLGIGESIEPESVRSKP
jgi:hypothetical protein